LTETTPLTPLRMRRLAQAAYALRDTLFDGPVSVCPGTPEILAHRAQAGGDVRGPPRPAKPATTNAPGRTRRSGGSPSASRPWRGSATRTCALRDTFFDGLVSVCPGTPEILALRAQAGGDVRGPPRLTPPRPAKPAATNAPVRTPRPKQRAATPVRWLGWNSLFGFAPERRVLQGSLFPEKIGRAPYRPTDVLLNVVALKHMLTAAIRTNLREFRPRSLHARAPAWNECAGGIPLLVS
jgi:hypothetical protein